MAESLFTAQIFIVDDDPFWREILKKVMTDLGYKNIKQWISGQECMDHLHLNPEIVFLDYQMENGNGLETLSKIKEYDSGIHVIFCTSIEDLGLAINALEAGSHEYLLKSTISKKEVKRILTSIS